MSRFGHFDERRAQRRRRRLLGGSWNDCITLAPHQQQRRGAVGQQRQQAGPSVEGLDGCQLQGQGQLWSGGWAAGRQGLRAGAGSWR